MDDPRINLALVSRSSLACALILVLVGCSARLGVQPGSQAIQETLHMSLDLRGFVDPGCAAARTISATLVSLDGEVLAPGLTGVLADAGPTVLRAEIADRARPPNGKARLVLTLPGHRLRNEVVTMTTDDQTPTLRLRGVSPAEATFSDLHPCAGDAGDFKYDYED